MQMKKRYSSRVLPGESDLCLRGVFCYRLDQERDPVEICSKCHPLFTGKQRIVDSGGQAEKFQKRYGGTEKKKKKA